MANTLLDLQKFFPQKHQDALITAVRNTNKITAQSINTKETWSIFPKEEKSNKIRSTLFEEILENLRAITDGEELRTISIKQNRSGNLGL